MKHFHGKGKWVNHPLCFADPELDKPSSEVFGRSVDDVDCVRCLQVKVSALLTVMERIRQAVS